MGIRCSVSLAILGPDRTVSLDSTHLVQQGCSGLGEVRLCLGSVVLGSVPSAAAQHIVETFLSPCDTLACGTTGTMVAKHIPAALGRGCICRGSGRVSVSSPGEDGGMTDHQGWDS